MPSGLRVNCTAEASAKILPLPRRGRLDQIADEQPQKADHHERQADRAAGTRAPSLRRERPPPL